MFIVHYLLLSLCICQIVFSMDCDDSKIRAYDYDPFPLKITLKPLSPSLRPKEKDIFHAKIISTALRGEKINVHKALLQDAINNYFFGSTKHALYIFNTTLLNPAIDDLQSSIVRPSYYMAADLCHTYHDEKTADYYKNCFNHNCRSTDVVITALAYFTYAQQISDAQKAQTYFTHAFQLFEKTYTQNNLISASYLTHCLALGKGCSVNISRALVIFNDTWGKKSPAEFDSLCRPQQIAFNYALQAMKQLAEQKKICEVDISQDDSEQCIDYSQCVAVTKKAEELLQSSHIVEAVELLYKAHKNIDAQHNAELSKEWRMLLQSTILYEKVNNFNEKDYTPDILRKATYLWLTGYVPEDIQDTQKALSFLTYILQNGSWTDDECIEIHIRRGLVYIQQALLKHDDTLFTIEQITHAEKCNVLAKSYGEKISSPSKEIVDSLYQFDTYLAEARYHVAVFLLCGNSTLPHQEAAEYAVQFLYENIKGNDEQAAYKASRTLADFLFPNKNGRPEKYIQPDHQQRLAWFNTFLEQQSSLEFAFLLAKYYESIDYHQAITYYSRIIDAESTNYPEAWFQRAILYYLTGQFDQAEKDFDTCLQCDKPVEYGVVWWYKTIIHLRKNNDSSDMNYILSLLGKIKEHNTQLTYLIRNIHLDTLAFLIGLSGTIMENNNTEKGALELCYFISTICINTACIIVPPNLSFPYTLASINGHGIKTLDYAARNGNLNAQTALFTVNHPSIPFQTKIGYWYNSLLSHDDQSLIYIMQELQKLSNSGLVPVQALLCIYCTRTQDKEQKVRNLLNTMYTDGGPRTHRPSANESSVLIFDTLKASDAHSLLKSYADEFIKNKQHAPLYQRNAALLLGFIYACDSDHQELVRSAIYIQSVFDVLPEDALCTDGVKNVLSSIYHKLALSPNSTAAMHTFYLQKSSNLGHSDATNLLVKDWFNTNKNISTMDSSLLSRITAAASKNNPQSLFYLGEYYCMIGKHELAENYLKQAAEHGHAYASTLQELNNVATQIDKPMQSFMKLRIKELLSHRFIPHLVIPKSKDLSKQNDYLDQALEHWINSNIVDTMSLLQKAIEQDKQCALAHLVIAYCLLETTGIFSEVEDHIITALNNGLVSRSRKSRITYCVNTNFLFILSSFIEKIVYTIDHDSQKSSAASRMLVTIKQKLKAKNYNITYLETIIKDCLLFNLRDNKVWKNS